MLINKHTIGVILLFLADLLTICFIFAATIIVRTALPLIIPGYPEYAMNIIDFWWFFPVWMATLVYEGAYSNKFTFWDEVQLLWRVSLFSTIAILAIVVLGQLGIALSRTVIILIGVLSLPLFPVLRIALKRLLRRFGLLTSKVLIIGTGTMGRIALHAVQREHNLGYEVIGFIYDGGAEEHRSLEGIRVHGYLSHVKRYVRNCDIQDIVIALPDQDREALSKLINKLQHKAKNVLYFPEMSGMAVIGTELRQFFQDQVFALEIRNNLAQPLNYALKRSLDFLAGLVLFFVFIIPIGIISLLIRLTSEGPAIFHQDRIGKGRRPFKCHKFRTMYRDADERLETILANDPEARREWETFWKLKDDPRVTPVGKFLRNTSLDELPQIFNVLKGEMTLVGPRPYLPREWDALEEHSDIIHGVQPGITGLWQVSGRSDSSYEQRLSLDSWYVRNWNLWLGILILMKTIRGVIK